MSDTLDPDPRRAYEVVLADLQVGIATKNSELERLAAIVDDLQTEMAEVKARRDSEAAAFEHLSAKFEAGWPAVPTAETESSAAADAEAQGPAGQEADAAASRVIVPYPAHGSALKSALSDGLLAVLNEAGRPLTVSELTIAVGRDPGEPQLNSTDVTMRRLAKQGRAVVAGPSTFAAVHLAGHHGDGGRDGLEGCEASTPSADPTTADSAVAEPARPQSRRARVIDAMSRHPERAWTTRELSEALEVDLSGRFREMLRIMADAGLLVRRHDDGTLRYLLGSDVNQGSQTKLPASDQTTERQTRVLEILQGSAEPMRARQVNRIYGAPDSAGQVEAMRSTLTRLAAQGKAVKLPDGRFTTVRDEPTGDALTGEEDGTSDPAAEITDQELVGLLASSGREMALWDLVAALKLAPTAGNAAVVNTRLQRLVEAGRIVQTGPDRFEVRRHRDAPTGIRTLEAAVTGS